MQIRNRQDFWSGLMFIAFGLGFSWQASHYPIGTATHMGPGYFPFFLGIILALMGALVMLTAFAKKAGKAQVEKFDWRILLLVLGSVVLYGVILPLLGVFLSVFVLVILSSLASHQFGWKAALANALFLVLFVYLAFIKGLRLSFPLWPPFHL